MRVPPQRKVLEYYGIQNQTIIWMEEASELAKAVSKAYRYPEDIEEHRREILSEVADVMICIEQIMEAYSLTDRMLSYMIVRKHCRNIARMDGETVKEKKL